MKTVPISQKVGDYHAAISLYAANQTLPALLDAIQKALQANASLDAVCAVTKEILVADTDQFWGASGSLYFRRSTEELDSLLPYRPASQHLSHGLSIIWGLAVKIKPAELVTFDRTWVNWREYTFLDAARSETSTIDVVLPEQTKFPMLDKLREQIVDTIVEQDKLADQSIGMAERCEALGVGMVPWAIGLIEYGLENTELFRELRQLSAYLENYYRAPNQKLGIYTARTQWQYDLTEAEREKLAKLFCALLFSRLLEPLDIATDSIEDCLANRLKHAAGLSASTNPSWQVRYLASIENAALLCSFLGANAITLGVLSEQELKREHLDFIGSGDLDCFSLMMTPDTAASHLLSIIEPYEGDRENSIDIGDLLRIAPLGQRRKVEREKVEEFLLRTIGSRELTFFEELVDYGSQSVNKWAIPLELIDSLVRLVEWEFFSDYRIRRNLTSALRKMDETGNYQSDQLPSSLVVDAFIELQPEPEDHPALFAQKFSSRSAFLEYPPNRWPDFIESLAGQGQYHHACVVCALLFQIQGVLESAGVRDSNRLSPIRIGKVLDMLRPYRSFQLVEESLHGYLGSNDAPKAEFHGIYAAFVSKGGAKVVSLATRINDEQKRYETELIEKGIPLNRLRQETRARIVKGYACSRDSSLVAYGLRVDAVLSYATGIEAELKNWIGTVPPEVERALGTTGLNLEFRTFGNGPQRKRSINGLSGLAKLTRGFKELVPSVQAKLPGLKRLAESPMCHDFCDGLIAIARLRNSIAHGDFREDEKFAEKLVSEIESILFDGKVLEILCDAAPIRLRP
jgi:hypothetical protein